MTETIIPLRPRGEGEPTLARIDRVAAELLAGGRAASLLGARAEVLLTDLRAQRDHLTALLADLRGQEPTGDAQTDATDANLIAAINSGIVQIDLFIARTRAFVAEAARSGSDRSSAPGSTP